MKPLSLWEAMLRVIETQSRVKRAESEAHFAIEEARKSGATDDDIAKAVSFITRAAAR